MPPEAEIRRVQVSRIKQLLTETNFTLERISELSGFEHPEYLSVVFKRLVDQTPGQYRKQTQPRFQNSLGTEPVPLRRSQTG
jgi:LacI family transcriptional regulator